MTVLLTLGQVDVTGGEPVGDPIRFTVRRLGRERSLSLLAALAVLALTAISLWGKLINQYGFYIYPDSYYYLLIAENLHSHFRVIGTLGPGGMPFPPPGYASMKVTFPVLVATALFFGLNSDSAGHAVSLIAAVASTPLAYWAVKRWLDSVPSGLAAASLVATSYGLTYWSGFIMSDSVSVALCFLLLGLLTLSGDDQWGRPADLGTGVAAVALLLSRPTYIVAFPLIIYVGWARWNWTSRRILTSAAAAMFTVSTIALRWFPPSTFSGSILARLSPILGAALLFGAAVVWIIRSGKLNLPSAGTRLVSVAAVSLTAVFLIVWLVQFSQSPLGDGGLFPGFARFGRRDFATLLLLVPGAYVLSKRGRGLEAVALSASAVALLGVYFWAEPRESRYLIHLLPLLVPVAAGAAMFPSRTAASTAGARREIALQVAKYAPVVLSLLLLCGFQANRSLQTASAAFLKTAYPREVARNLGELKGKDVTVVTALPWPYYFHLRRPTWGAGVVYSPRLFDYISKESSVAVLDDASLRFHYRALAESVEATAAKELVPDFRVPVSYQYGYYSSPDHRSVRVYGMTSEQLFNAK